MPARPLSPEERALWARVAATMRALEGRIARSGIENVGPSGPLPPPAPAKAAPAPRQAPGKRIERPTPPADTLDGGWDRRLRRGLVPPERSIDLHGHSLAGAHAALDDALERAVADEVRLLLVVTGRPPRGSDETAPRRGLIRAAIGDWLGASRHADRIAAVRHDHPRHGGAGALYLVLRRRRAPARGG